MSGEGQFDGRVVELAVAVGDRQIEHRAQGGGDGQGQPPGGGCFADEPQVLELVGGAATAAEITGEPPVALLPQYLRVREATAEQFQELRAVESGNVLAPASASVN